MKVIFLLLLSFISLISLSQVDSSTTLAEGTEVDSSEIENGRYGYNNPHPSKYLIGPSAIPLKAGDGYYQNIFLTTSSVQYGITDHLSVGAGLELVTTLLAHPVYFVNVRISYPLAEKIYAGAGIYHGGMISFGKRSSGDWDETTATLGYGIITLGSTNTNISVSAGYPIRFEYSPETVLPSFSFSGIARFSRRMAFISENHIIPSNSLGDGKGYYGFYSYGLRAMGEKISLDIAFVNSPDLAYTFKIGIPFLDLVVKF